MDVPIKNKVDLSIAKCKRSPEGSDSLPGRWSYGTFHDPTAGSDLFLQALAHDFLQNPTTSWRWRNHWVGENFRLPNSRDNAKRCGSKKRTQDDLRHHVCICLPFAEARKKTPKKPERLCGSPMLCMNASPLSHPICISYTYLNKQ